MNPEFGHLGDQNVGESGEHEAEVDNILSIRNTGLAGKGVN